MLKKVELNISYFFGMKSPDEIYYFEARIYETGLNDIVLSCEINSEIMDGGQFSELQKKLIESQCVIFEFVPGSNFKEIRDSVEKTVGNNLFNYRYFCSRMAEIQRNLG
jgi:hypothetical protein